MGLLADALFPLVYYVVPVYGLCLVCFAFATEFLVFYLIQGRAASLWYTLVSDGLANLCSAAPVWWRCG